MVPNKPGNEPSRESSVEVVGPVTYSEPFRELEGRRHSGSESRRSEPGYGRC